ncbi:MAG: Hpt domain-containing protein [Armatimonadetes bacterium]|nr:Hpt domain-containing protein [Armatimonadota bacterium]
MTAELDLSQYLDLFLRETGEHLGILEREILMLEADHSPERMEIILRSTHTIKASSQTMGFHQIASLTHEMENVLQPAHFSVSNRDALLQAVDSLKWMACEIADGQKSNTDCGLLLSILRGLSKPATLAEVLNRFAKGAEDLCRKLGKEVKVKIEGSDTELDGNLTAAISGPILQLLRNCVDHGIEQPHERLAAEKPRAGQILIKVQRQGDFTKIEVSDDGRGIDVEQIKAKSKVDHLSDSEALQLIFASGFSTKTPANEISGRGIGMDIVRTEIERIGGQIEVKSQPSSGTTFVLTVPSKLDTLQGLLVSIHGGFYLIPVASVLGTVPLAPSPALTNSQNCKTGKNTGQEQSENAYVVIVGSAEQQIGLVVDNLIGEREVVINALNKIRSGVAELSEATIIDVNSLLAGLTTQGRGNT